MNAVTRISTATMLEPKNIDEALRFAELLSKSELLPKDYIGKPGNVLVAIQFGAELGMQPLQAMQSLSVINGRPSLWGDGMLAIVRGSGLMESINEEIGEEVCACTVKRRGEEPLTRTFSKADAKQAGLLGKQGPWQTATKRMLQLRARAFALRDAFPDVLKGVQSAEMLRDIPEERDITPASAPAAIMEKLGIEGPTLEGITERINAAKTDAQMKAIARDAKSLPPDDLAQARELWGMKKSAMAAQAAEVVDAETGEISAAAADRQETQA
jgi:hypothetical protein